MNNNNQVTSEVPGTEEDVKTDYATIEKWVARDIKACISFLTAIDQDPDLRRLMSQWFHGRVQNWQNRPKGDPLQGNLFNK